MRWVHNGELVSPARFVGLMEQSGHIFALDRHVWGSVCAWQRSLVDWGIAPVPVSVNVSRVDFYFDDIATHFIDLAGRYRIEPRLLGIEITESAYSEDGELVTSVARRLREAGFPVLMDDFGTGYSSLNMLRSVSVDALKMDKGFIDQADTSDGGDAIIESVIRMAQHERVRGGPGDQGSIIESIIRMAQRLGLPVISEGVETEEQRDSLRSMDCDYVQGYFYYRPMPKEEFERLLSAL